MAKLGSIGMVASTVLLLWLFSLLVTSATQPDRNISPGEVVMEMIMTEVMKRLPSAFLPLLLADDSRTGHARDDFAEQFVESVVALNNRSVGCTGCAVSR